MYFPQSTKTEPNGTVAGLNGTVNITIAHAWPSPKAKISCPAAYKYSVNDNLKVILAIIPFIVVFQGILGLRISSRKVAVSGLASAILIGMYFFVDTSVYINATLAETMGRIFLLIFDRVLWTTFDYALNMGSALFFLGVLKRWGVVEQIRREFLDITQDGNLLVMLVMFCFGMVLAVVAPGGTNYLLAGAILIKMNVSSPITEAEEQNVVEMYDRRHATCTKKGCKHATATTKEKLQTESNNRVGTIALFGNALASAFNLLGVCITATVPLLSPFDPRPDRPQSEQELQKYGELQLGKYFAAQIWLVSVASPFIMNYIFSQRKTLCQRVGDPALQCSERLIMLATGIVYASVQLGVAGWLGPQLPCLIAGLASLVVFVLLLKSKEIYNRTWPDKRNRRYLLPFFLLILILILIRLVPKVESTLSGEEWTESTADKVLSPVFRLKGFTEREQKGYSKVDFPWIIHSGVILCVITLCTPFMVPYENPDPSVELTIPVTVFPDQRRVDKNMERQYWETAYLINKAKNKFGLALKKRRKHMAQAQFRARYKTVMLESFYETLDDTGEIILTITSFASMAKLMADFGMTQLLAETMANGLSESPNAYALVAPLIGMLGSGLTGSTTTSNFLFASLQANTAINLGIVTQTRNSVYEVGGVQILGSSAGEIISPMNAVVITLLKGVDKRESEFIMDLIPVALFWLSLCMLTSVVFLVPASGGID
eukprot:g71485.t1